MKLKAKEILIGILILVVIFLAFTVLLYEDIPLSKTVPTPTEYQASQEVKQELKEIAIEDNANIILTYEVTDSDLGVYENTRSYDKGKANPFSSYSSQTASSSGTSNNANSSTTTNTNTGSSTTTTTTTEGTATSGQTTTNNNSESQTTNTFYEDTRTK